MRTRNWMRLIASLMIAMSYPWAVQAQTSNWKGKITLEHGVAVVWNPVEPIIRGEIMALTEELKLGGGEAQGDYAFSGIQTVAVDAAENIYALDYKDCYVKVFDKTGKFLRTIGRKGQGPGELNGVRSLAFERATGMLVILELSSRRISYFDVQGKYLKSIPFKGDLPLRLAIDSRGRVYIQEGVLGEKETTYLFKVFTPDLASSTVIVQAPSLINPAGGTDPFRPVATFALDGQDRFVYGFPKDYTIDYYGPEGKIARRVHKDYRPVEVTPSEIERAKKDTPPSLKMDIGNIHAAFRRFFADPEGRLFVQTFEKPASGKGHRFDVFDPEGRFLGTAALPDTSVLIFNGRLYTLEEDEDGYPMIKRYAVRWHLK